MNKRVWLGVLLVTMPAAGFIAVGCGGDSDDSSATPDSGADVVVEKDATPDVVVVVDAAPARCDDGGIENLSIPDAALGDGGATTATCLTCTKESCASQIKACDKDCDCENGIDDALTCIGEKGGLDSTCIGDLQDNSAATALGECLYLSCQNECGIGALFGDAGPNLDAGDAGD
ncbi:MAG TPA: hypothetical protein VF407_25045 [Polyangiaceae bacterium]